MQINENLRLCGYFEVNRSGGILECGCLGRGAGCRQTHTNRQARNILEFAYGGLDSANTSTSQHHHDNLSKTLHKFTMCVAIFLVRISKALLAVLCQS